jgi:hypothetical protein
MGDLQKTEVQLSLVALGFRRSVRRKADRCNFAQWVQKSDRELRREAATKIAESSNAVVVTFLQ